VKPGVQGFEFVNKIRWRYRAEGVHNGPAENGMKENLAKSRRAIAGFPMIDIKVSMVRWLYHGRRLLRNGLQNCRLRWAFKDGVQEKNEVQSCTA